jgi:hypothetical protein
MAAESVGAWFYKATGSGVFINTGTTLHYLSHADAVKDILNETCTDYECGNLYPALFNECAARGVQTVQFLKNADMRCGNTAIEIVDTGATSFQTRLPMGWLNTPLLS